jgi:PRTRC genetic system protein E
VFVELMPLLARRTVLITVAKVDDKTLRVNVIPALAKADESPALTTPLTCTGPPEELDAQLGKHLAGHVQTHQQTASTLAEAKATMEAAAKAAQEEAKRKAEERKKVTQKPPATATTVEPTPSASLTPGEPVPSSASTSRAYDFRDAEERAETLRGQKDAFDVGSSQGRIDGPSQWRSRQASVVRCP